MQDLRRSCKRRKEDSKSKGQKQIGLDIIVRRAIQKRGTRVGVSFGICMVLYCVIEWVKTNQKEIKENAYANQSTDIRYGWSHHGLDGNVEDLVRR